jgi:GNAT superfamily N-acetyltransferase
VPSLTLRDAQEADCDALSQLAFVSKASWGYDDAFMEACRADLTILPKNLRNARLRIADENNMVGFHGVVGDELEWLFVAPDAQRRGVGATLLADACTIAATAGVRELFIEADPFAAAFYEHAGARLVGERPSSAIPGRVLPLYSLDVSLFS